MNVVRTADCLEVGSRSGEKGNTITDEILVTYTSRTSWTVGVLNALSTSKFPFQHLKNMIRDPPQMVGILIGAAQDNGTFH